MLPYILLGVTVVLVFINFLAFMQVFSLFITLPALFISIYVTLFSFTRQRLYRPMR